MTAARALAPLALLLAFAQGAEADHIYFSINGVTQTSSWGSSSTTRFTFGTLPPVVHLSRPGTVIITTQRPATTVMAGDGQYVTVFGNSPVIVQTGPQVIVRPGPSSQYYAPLAPGGWYNTVPWHSSTLWQQSRPWGDNYPGFPYSFSRYPNPPSVTALSGLPNWANSSTTQSFRRGWTLLGR